LPTLYADDGDAQGGKSPFRSFSQKNAPNLKQFFTIAAICVILDKATAFGSRRRAQELRVFPNLRAFSILRSARNGDDFDARLRFPA
jgi:hypothetical protein